MAEQTKSRPTASKTKKTSKTSTKKTTARKSSTSAPKSRSETSTKSAPKEQASTVEPLRLYLEDGPSFWAYCVSPTKTVHLTLAEWQGSFGIDLRTFYECKENEGYATHSKGVRVPVDEIDGLIEGLTALRDEAAEQDLL